MSSERYIGAQIFTLEATSDGTNVQSVETVKKKGQAIFDLGEHEIHVLQAEGHLVIVGKLPKDYEYTVHKKEPETSDGIILDSPRKANIQYELRPKNGKDGKVVIINTRNPKEIDDKYLQLK